jgi:parvulin-like peptidyl-prolyl isomerase
MLNSVKRLLFPLLAVLLATVLLAACSDSDNASIGAPAAATVNGVDISEDALLAQLGAAASVEAYGPQLLGLTGTVTGEAPNTYSTAASAEVLTTLIAFELIDQELAERDLEITDDDLTAAEETAAQILGTSAETGQADPVAGQELLDQLDDEARTTLLDGLAGASLLGEAFAEEMEIGEVTDEAVRAAYDEDPAAFSTEESCVRHILVMPVDPESGAEATPEESEAARVEAEGILDELDGGADFETLARERSDDTTSGAEGGDLGCNPREAFIPEFDEAVWSLDVGGTSEVVESSAGFHILQVYDRRTPTFEDVADQIRTQLEGQAQQDAQAATQEAFAQIILDADVTVDPRYGTWEYFVIGEAGEEQVDNRDDAQVARVVPPGGPTTTTASTLAPLLGEQPLELPGG